MAPLLAEIVAATSLVETPISMATRHCEIVAATSLVETQTSMATLLGGIVTVRPHDVVLIHLVIPLADNNL
jgi:hypothetical protein